MMDKIEQADVFKERIHAMMIDIDKALKMRESVAAREESQPYRTLQSPKPPLGIYRILIIWPRTCESSTISQADDETVRRRFDKVVYILGFL